MKKFIVAMFVMGALSAAVTGCKGEVEVDPDGHVSHFLPAPR
jgi:hypothetical protein